jgi:hypothetical protein
MPSAVKPPRTLYDKVFEDHIVNEKDDGTILLYIGMVLLVVQLNRAFSDNMQTGTWCTK